MSFEKNKAILFCYGVGGHEEQAKRLVNILKNEDLNNTLEQYKLIGIGDIGKTTKVSVERYYQTGEMRDKHTNANFLSNPLGTIWRTFSLLKELRNTYEVSALVSTGPGNCIVLGAICRLFGIPVVHIETWSRFYTKSITGKYMYYIANMFIVQNEEQLKIYKKAVYGGRL